eukprot:1190928-Prymnesium_polylepis.2
MSSRRARQLMPERKAEDESGSLEDDGGCNIAPTPDSVVDVVLDRGKDDEDDGKDAEERHPRKNVRCRGAARLTN